MADFKRDLEPSHSNSLDWGDEKVPGPIHNERVVPAIVTIENFRVLGMDPQDEEFYMNFSEERRKKVKRKVSSHSPLLGMRLFLEGC